MFEGFDFEWDVEEEVEVVLEEEGGLTDVVGGELVVGLEREEGVEGVGVPADRLGAIVGREDEVRVR